MIQPDEISNKFADLHDGLQRFDFNFRLSRDLAVYERGGEQYEALAVLLQECVAIDKDTADSICSNLIPPYAKHMFDRFLTGEYLDVTPPATKEKIREYHNFDILNHTFNEVVAATTMGDGRILARSFDRYDDTKLLVRFWEQSAEFYRTEAEFDNALAVRKSANPSMLVTLDKKNYVIPDRLVQSPVTLDKTLVPAQLAKKRLEMGL
jgi:hypothetical protein